MSCDSNQLGWIGLGWVGLGGENTSLVMQGGKGREEEEKEEEDPGKWQGGKGAGRKRGGFG